MSAKAARLAASLATLANSAMIGKSTGYAVTVTDMMPVASALVRLDKRSARIDRQLARNGKILAAMTGPSVTGIPAADVAAAAEAQQLARLRAMTPNGVNLHKPTTTGRPDVDPRHDG